MELPKISLEVLKSERAGLSLQKEIQVQEEVWGLQKVRKKYAGGYKKKYGGYKKYDNYRYGGYKKYDDYGYMGGYEPECKQDYGLVVSLQSKYISLKISISLTTSVALEYFSILLEATEEEVRGCVDLI